MTKRAKTVPITVECEVTHPGAIYFTHVGASAEYEGHALRYSTLIAGGAPHLSYRGRGAVVHHDAMAAAMLDAILDADDELPSRSGASASNKERRTLARIVARLDRAIASEQPKRERLAGSDLSIADKRDVSVRIAGQSVLARALLDLIDPILANELRDPEDADARTDGSDPQ